MVGEVNNNSRRTKKEEFYKKVMETKSIISCSVCFQKQCAKRVI
jgi:hypothetical protein